MLESFSANNELQYQKLSAEEQQRRGILGRLVGIIADFKGATRNGRRYTEELWDKTFENPIMKEKIANRCLFGELGHPADRSEVDMSKIAICMAETPKKGSDGKLHGVFDILSTPNGQILKTLCDYGCKIGVSSRGQGDTFTDYDGQETVDADTFDCECWDAVLLPAVKEARLTYVTESLDTSKLKLKKALQESLANANEADKKIMTDTLEELEIEYKDSSEIKEEVVDIENEVAENNGTDLVNELQEALKENQNLQKQILELQEKLSVSYTKEIKLEESNTSLKNSVKQLTESVSRAKALSSQLETMKAQLERSVQSNEHNKKLIESYKRRLSETVASRTSLTESVSNKDSQINKLNESISHLNENMRNMKADHKRMVESLNSEISTLKQESEIKNSQYATKLTKCNKLVESYKELARKAVDKYIDSKAVSLGINANEIRNKLKENYSFDDIDSVCENLRSYKLNMSKLPFNFNKNVQGVALKEDTSTQKFINPDDVVDKSLFNII